MKKIKLGSKILLISATAAVAGATVGICCFAGTKSSNPLQYNQEVDAKVYAANKDKKQSFDYFPHNYHSMDYQYQKLYWLDISRENIHDPVYNETAPTKFEPYHLDKDDHTLDRFTNLFYPEDTIVSIWTQNATKDDEGKAYTAEGTFKDQSVLTNWTSQNGFAYISDFDIAFDTQSERDDYKKNHTQEDYDAMLAKYNSANSFLNAFGGNRNVAQYFFSGIKAYANDGLGIKEEETVDGKVVNIENAKLTKYSIQKFVDLLIKESSTRGEITLDFSQLYLTDLDRDNSVLALLNPQLWEYLLTSCIDKETSYTTKITKIDLSYNNLRAVPNLASIRDKTDEDWFWEDYSGELGIGHSTLGEHTEGGMNKVCEGSVGLISSPQQDGYFDGIDLSNNNLTYFDFNAYNPWDSTRGNWGEGYGKMQELKEAGSGSSRVPGIITLVKCRYNSFEDVYNFDYILDPSELKPKDDKLIGINLDYNRLPWIMMNPLVNADDENYVWWRPMLHSWYGFKLGQILPEWLGIDLPDYILTCARAYLTYTIANYRGSGIDSVLTILEYIFGLGTYQLDGVNWTDKEIYNYINMNADDFGRNLMLKRTSGSVTLSEAWQLFDRYIGEFLKIGQLMSFPLNKSLVDADVIGIKPKIIGNQYTSDSISGLFEIPISYQLARIKYLPDSFELKDDTSLNQLATKIFSTIGINQFIFIDVPGFVKDYSSAIGVSVGISAVILAIIIIAVIRLIANIRHQYEYRLTELDTELSVDDKKKKTKKDKKDKK